MPVKRVRKLTPADLFSHPTHFFALGFGSGLSPFAPGTLGTLAAVPLYGLSMHYAATFLPVFVLIAAIVGVYLCGVTAKNLQVHDHSGVVWDEIAGYGVTMLWLPFQWQWALAGFMLFRFFDILKPWPICWLDRQVPGGVGMMLDDIVAGGAACGVLHTVRVLLN